MAEVASSIVGTNDSLIQNNNNNTTTMRQTNDNERRTIFTHRSKDEDELKTTSSPTKIIMMHKRQELENRILQMVSGGSAKLDLDQHEEEEQEGRQQVQERIEDQQQDVESRNQHQTNDESKTHRQPRRDSAATDVLQQEMSPQTISAPEEESPLNLNNSQTITVSPNLLSFSDKDQHQSSTKPNRWRSLDMSLEQAQEVSPQRRGSLDQETFRFARQRQWQRDLRLSTREDVQSTVQDKIRIQELEKKVSSLLHDLHETIEHETELEETVLNLTNENDLLKEQVLQLQKQLNAIRPSSNEGTETSTTSVESSSQDPLFADSDSARKEKESSSSASPEGESSDDNNVSIPQQHPPPEHKVANELTQETDVNPDEIEEQGAEPSEPTHVEDKVPMAYQNPDAQQEEPRNKIQVDWTPPTKPSQAVHDPKGVAAEGAPQPHPPKLLPNPPPQRGFCIDTCDNSTLSYSLYKGMAEIYDGTVDTGMEDEAKPQGHQREDSQDDNWEFLTERVSL